MFPASQGLNLDVEAISGIFGSISIACWVTVFSPQILENFRRRSAASLSVQFIIVWSLGDLFNVIGGVLQGVLPTMIILAVYYLLADIVLLGQCFYYRGFTWRDEVIPPAPSSERTALLQSNGNGERARLDRQHSNWSEVDVTHLSPATPLMVTPDKPAVTEPQRRTTLLQAALFNSLAILMVVIAGVFGWWVSNRSQGGSQRHDRKPVHQPGEDALQLSLWGQIFGYGCALLYLGSRLPQILLNYRRKSTEGLSGLFFLFACLGNVTYFLSIFAYDPACHGPDGQCADGEARAIYGRYMLVNASWLLGSIGCLFLDFTILLQFFLYRPLDIEEDEEDAEDRNGATETSDGRPLLDRADSTF